MSRAADQPNDEYSARLTELTGILFRNHGSGKYISQRHPRSYHVERRPAAFRPDRLHWMRRGSLAQTHIASGPLEVLAYAIDLNEAECAAAENQEAAKT